MEVATLLIAVLGVALGVASLTWQIVAHVLSGGRVKVTLKVGGHSGQAMASMPANKVTPASLKQITSQGFSQPVIAVDVRNVGRMPVTVERWGITSAQGIQAIPWGNSIGPTLPRRLESGESASWAVDLSTALNLAQVSLAVLGKGKSSTRIVGVVELADGRMYKTPEAFGA